MAVKNALLFLALVAVASEEALHVCWLNWRISRQGGREGEACEPSDVSTLPLPPCP